MDKYATPSSSSSTTVEKTMKDRLEEILDHGEAQMTCSICSDLMTNPSTAACGHTFCNGCIEDWFNTKENCPICREPCVGGLHSDTVVPMAALLKHLKPLVHQRQLNDEKKLIKKSTPGTTNPPSNINTRVGQKPLTKSQNERLNKFLGERLKRTKTVEEHKALEAAIWFVRNAVATGTSYDEILEDIQRLESHPEEVINKYCTNENLENSEEYQYIPTVRTHKISLEWPTNRSWIQIFILLFFSTCLYTVISTLDNDGYSVLQEPLLRALSMLNLYIDLLDFFR